MFVCDGYACVCDIFLDTQNQTGVSVPIAATISYCQSPTGPVHWVVTYHCGHWHHAMLSVSFEMLFVPSDREVGALCKTLVQGSGFGLCKMLMHHRRARVSVNRHARQCEWGVLRVAEWSAQSWQDIKLLIITEGQ